VLVKWHQGGGEKKDLPTKRMEEKTQKDIREHAKNMDDFPFQELRRVGAKGSYIEATRSKAEFTN